MPVPSIDPFAAKFVVVAKLALLTHGLVFCLFLLCGRVFAHLPGLPPVILLAYLLRGVLGALAVIAVQLLLAMCIRSFAVPILLGLIGGITGMPAGKYGRFFLSCLVWLGVFFSLAAGILKRQDVQA